MVSLWASGVVLFCRCQPRSQPAHTLTVNLVNTSLSTVYKSHFTYSTMAGIGAFDGSLVRPYMDYLTKLNQDVINGTFVPNNRSVVPYTTFALTHGIITNPQHSVSAPHTGCDNDMCDSYILPGGLETARPYPPTNYTDYPIMLLESVPATQIDFLNGADPAEVMTDDDCDLFEQRPWSIAIRVCVAPSRVKDGTFVAGR